MRRRRPVRLWMDLLPPRDLRGFERSLGGCVKISRVEKSLGTAMRAASEALTFEELGRTAVPHLARALNAPIHLLLRIVDPGQTSLSWQLSRPSFKRHYEYSIVQAPVCRMGRRCRRVRSGRIRSAESLLGDASASA